MNGEKKGTRKAHHDMLEEVGVAFLRTESKQRLRGKPTGLVLGEVAPRGKGEEGGAEERHMVDDLALDLLDELIEGEGHWRLGMRRWRTLPPPPPPRFSGTPIRRRKMH